MRIAIIFLFVASVTLSVFAASTLETWKKTEDAAAAASKIGHYREAEALLLSNQKLAEVFPPKDARLPHTLFDLAQVYRAEGKYSEALGLYERARQLYIVLYGEESGELAQTLDGEGELYKSLGDFEQAEPLLLKSLEMRNKQSSEEAAIAESKSDLGEAYTALGQFDKAEPLLLDALGVRKKLNLVSADTGQSLIAVGVLYEKTSRAKQAEDSYREAASITWPWCARPARILSQPSRYSSVFWKLEKLHLGTNIET
jgi:tetratricopeptide (TPR) repeat protein